MNCIPTKIDGVVIFEPKIFSDERGYFMESFNAENFQKFLPYPVDFCQANESVSSKGTLRGLHYQLEPMAQSKLVRVVEGRVLDVAVDIRKNSKTFGQHVSVELSAENNRQLFVPKGFAHGFIVLSDTAKFLYQVDTYYSPEHERGILFSDPDLAIDWGMDFSDITVSQKDMQAGKFSEAEVF